mgnify:CR=1 FL=1
MMVSLRPVKSAQQMRIEQMRIGRTACTAAGAVAWSQAWFKAWSTAPFSISRCAPGDSSSSLCVTTSRPSYRCVLLRIDEALSRSMIATSRM